MDVIWTPVLSFAECNYFVRCLYTLVSIIICTHRPTYSCWLSGASLIAIHYTISDETGNHVIRQHCRLCPHSVQIKVYFYSAKYKFISSQIHKGRTLGLIIHLCACNYISVSSYSSTNDFRQKFIFALQIQTMYFRAAVIFRNALLSLLEPRQNL